MESMRNMFRRFMETEPALLVGTVSALLALLVNFGLPLTGVQVDSILQFITNALLFMGAVAGVRQSVYAPVTTQKIADRAAVTGNTNIGEPPTGNTMTPVGPSLDIDESEKR